jgi:DNA replication and repair protein RecF
VSIVAVTLKNYRNFEDLKVILDPHINFFIGKNGQGKSNFLEAVYFVAYLRSLRTSQIKNLIRMNAAETFIDLDFKSSTQNKNWKILLNETGIQNLRINGAELSSTKEALGQLPLIFFQNEDLEIISGSAEKRRRFLDFFLASWFPLYSLNLSQYLSMLKQKNSYLKKISIEKINPDLELLATYNESLAAKAEIVEKYRFQTVQNLNTALQKLFKEIFNLEIDIRLEWVNDTGPYRVGWREEFLQLLNRGMAQEIKKGRSLVGPHHDDFYLYWNGFNARYFCSQGQKRLLALGLRLFEAGRLKEQGLDPIYVLDDVLLELDQDRVKSFLNFFTASKSDFPQVLFAGTSSENFPEDWKRRAKVFEVLEGNIR